MAIDMERSMVWGIQTQKRKNSAGRNYERRCVMDGPDAPMVEFALDYARRGWPVFPCKPTNKSPTQGRLSRRNNRRSNDPQMVGQIGQRR